MNQKDTFATPQILYKGTLFAHSQYLKELTQKGYQA